MSLLEQDEYNELNPYPWIERCDLPFIEACRKVTDGCTAHMVQGMILDLFTASAVVQVYDAVNEGNKAKLVQYAKKNGGAATVDIVWKLLKTQS